MKIAIIGSFEIKAPGETGKIHAPLLLSYHLAKKLSEMGHRISFFGLYSEEAKKMAPKIVFEDFGCKPVSDKDRPYFIRDSIGNRLNVVFEQSYIARVFRITQDFDLIYTWNGYRAAPFGESCDIPLFITHHDSTNMNRYNVIYDTFRAKNLFMVPISAKMKRETRFNNQTDVVFNAVDTEKIPFNPNPENYFSWVGRVMPIKGLHIAIDLAIKIGFNLKFAGPMAEFSEFSDAGKYITNIKDKIEQHKNIEYLGVLSQSDTYKFISNSRGFIFPSDGTESFSMVLAEAMVAGVPVVTTNLGPFPEIINEGVNGFLIKSQDDIGGFEQAIKKIIEIDRSNNRKDAINRFSFDTMAKNYEREFIKALGGLKNAKN